MPASGNTYITTLKKAHLEWGSYRHTNSRGTIYGEGYLHIPKPIAVQFGLYNSNHHPVNVVYNCNSVDGFLINKTLKATGSRKAGDIYAKQFQGNGDLQLIGAWFNYLNAQIGDRVRITWTSPTDIEIELI